MACVWIVEAENPQVPGKVVKVFDTEKLAEAEAMDLTFMVLATLCRGKLTRELGKCPTAWRQAIAAIQDDLMADEVAYVEVTRHEVVTSREVTPEA